MKKRLAIVLAAAMLAVAGSQLVFAAEGKESVPRPKVEAGESAVPEDEPRILTPDRESLEESPDILTPSGSLGKEPQEVLVEAPGEPDLETLKKQEAEWEKENKRLQELYDSLSEEESFFIWQQVQSRYDQEKQDWENRMREKAKRLSDYLKEELFPSQYTYLLADTDLTIGIPSMKQMEKIEKICDEYRKETGEGVICLYRLCRYSYKELEQAKTELEKNKELAELMGERNYSVENYNDHLSLSCTGGDAPGLDDWLERNGYQDMVVVQEEQKRFPE